MPDSDADPLDDVVPPPSPWRGAVVAVLVVLGVCALGGAMLHREAIDTWMRGESDFLGKRRWVAPHDVDRAALARIDLAKVHASLLPRYTIALSRTSRPADDSATRLAFRALREEAGRDTNLAELLDELDRIARQSVGENAERVLFLLWAWSDYLDRAGQPWHVDASIRRHQDGAAIFTTAYRRVADLAVSVGDHTRRARLFRRADRTNVVELYLGQASTADEGAIVVLDRVRDLALEDIWPMMDPANDESLDPLDRAYAPEVRREAALWIPAREIAALRASARARWAMERARRAIRARREGCGSRFTISRLSWSGLEPRWRARVRAMGDAGAPSNPCPEITASEADALASGSETLERTPDVHRGVSALVAWLARSVVVHEARHVADDADVGRDEPLACDGCPTFMRADARAEMSAFLASFATEGIAYTSLFVACHETRTVRGAHSSAMAVITQRIGARTCIDQPPRGLVARASDVERAMLGRSDRITLPRSYPPRVWLE